MDVKINFPKRREVLRTMIEQVLTACLLGGCIHSWVAFIRAGASILAGEGASILGGTPWHCGKADPLPVDRQP